MNTNLLEYFVYVIALDEKVVEIRKIQKANPNRDPEQPCVYVGHSVHPPEYRFEQHLNGYKANRYVKKYGLHLCPELYKKYNPLKNREEAEEQEEALALFLRSQGYTVWYGI